MSAETDPTPEYQSILDRNSERSWVDYRRWTLSLAIANGVSLGAAANALLQERSEALAALLVPSCWMFAIGLVAAGLLPRISHYLHDQTMTAAWHMIASYRGWKERPNMSDYKAQNRRFQFFGYGLEVLAAGGLAGGLLYPLVVICHRYITSGDGFF